MSPPDKDPDHWLYRLDAAEWLAAAETELAHAAETLARRATRPGVTHARRAAGMALNAALVLRPDERYGRSYMEHVVALAGDPGAPAEARDAATRLRDSGTAPPALISIGKPDLSALEAARAVVEHARRLVTDALAAEAPPPVTTG